MNLTGSKGSSLDRDRMKQGESEGGRRTDGDSGGHRCHFFEPCTPEDFCELSNEQTSKRTVRRE